MKTVTGRELSRDGARVVDAAIRGEPTALARGTVDGLPDVRAVVVPVAWYREAVKVYPMWNADAAAERPRRPE